MTKKLFLEVSVGASSSQQELLLPTLIESGSQGFLETESELKGYIEVTNWEEQKLQSFEVELKSLLRTISSNASISFKTFQEENWNEQWEQSIRPIEIGKRIAIKPSWCEYENKDKRIVIQIDPKMSFGTGYHETTRLTLLLLEKYLKVDCILLDVGTGTGILAIAGVKLGATSAIGIDIDEWSIENAKENGIANHEENRIEIKQAEIKNLQPNSYHIITANLTLNTNIELMQYFHDFLGVNGILLLSGLLQVDRDIMVKTLFAQQFELLEEVKENEWIALAARKIS